jgi:hypothetical protein
MTSCYLTIFYLSLLFLNYILVAKCNNEYKPTVTCFENSLQLQQCFFIFQLVVSSMLVIKLCVKIKFLLRKSGCCFDGLYHRHYKYSRPPKVQVPSFIDHIPPWTTSGATILFSRKVWREGANNSNHFNHCILRY